LLFLFPFLHTNATFKSDLDRKQEPREYRVMYVAKQISGVSKKRDVEKTNWDAEPKAKNMGNQSHKCTPTPNYTPPHPPPPHPSPHKKYL